MASSGAYALAGTVMLGWIASECLVLDSFMWPHALWGGMGLVQLLLVLVLLDVLRAQGGGEIRACTPSPG